MDNQADRQTYMLMEGSKYISLHIKDSGVFLLSSLFLAQSFRGMWIINNHFEAPKKHRQTLASHFAILDMVRDPSTQKVTRRISSRSRSISITNQIGLNEPPQMKNDKMQSKADNNPLKVPFTKNRNASKIWCSRPKKIL